MRSKQTIVLTIILVTILGTINTQQTFAQTLEKGWEKNAPWEVVDFMEDYSDAQAEGNRERFEVLSPEFDRWEEFIFESEIVDEIEDMVCYTYPMPNDSYYVYMTGKMKMDGLDVELLTGFAIYLGMDENGNLYEINKGISKETREQLVALSGSETIKKVVESTEKENKQIRKENPEVKIYEEELVKKSYETVRKAYNDAAESMTKEEVEEAKIVSDGESEDTIWVSENDSLWKIALLYYGDGVKWKDIYEKNRKQIGENPDLILPGQMLKVEK